MPMAPTPPGDQPAAARPVAEVGDVLDLRLTGCVVTAVRGDIVDLQLAGSEIRVELGSADVHHEKVGHDPAWSDADA